MGQIGRALSNIVGNIVAAIVMLIVAVLSFFLVIYVVNVGSGIAGLQPDANYIVIGASLIVSAGVIAGTRF